MSNVTAMKPRASAPFAEWLSPAEVCEVIPGMTMTLLQRMRDAGKGPRYAKPSAKTVVYSRADVDAWVRSTLVNTREQS
ncbi:hypothetical protein E0W80_04320 [Microbacterium sp. PI-1]|uniref:helix-turn-helix transcriptional regulator n=1 Tax=Microbacterium sp. PI-1 TaxID=2545631 RepID=UPI00103EF7B9|nr:helix-turn-helix domain-containing protein [Microbacterium sp. PI-1]TCJ28730.1 hypothetical protein E0W80_04320 [Microbacterium sp. PI-1]